MILQRDIAIHANEPCLGDFELARSLDLDLADITRLVERHAVELRDYHPLYATVSLPALGGAAEGRTYWLSEEQALLVAVFCRTPRSVAVRRSIIAAFRSWRLSEHAAVVNHFKRLERARRSRSAPASAA